VYRKILIVGLCALFASLALAQDASQNADAIKQFTRSGKIDGITLYFVHINNRTVDALFEAPTKYSMRARANMSTLLYVQGMPDSDANLTTEFVLEQDGQATSGTVHNIKNFKAGAVPKGERIDGIIQFETKLDLAHPFKIKHGDESVEFKLSREALKMLEPPQPPQ